MPLVIVNHMCATGRFAPGLESGDPCEGYCIMAVAAAPDVRRVMLRSITNEEFARLLRAMALPKEWNGRLGEYYLLSSTLWHLR